MSLTPEQWKTVAEQFDRLHESPAEVRRAALAELAAADAELAGNSRRSSTRSIAPTVASTETP